MGTMQVNKDPQKTLPAVLAHGHARTHTHTHTLLNLSRDHVSKGWREAKKQHRNK